MSKVHIVSNRLPVEIKLEKNEIALHHSVGGLATGLKSLPETQRGTWFGWPGIANETLQKIGLESAQKEIADKLKKDSNFPIFLSRKELDNYYYGFANQTLNPLFHYFPQYAVYKPDFWEKYVKVNQKFATEILKQIKPHDTIWIHDYHLFLLPELLRKEMPDLSIGFFLHIPFPSSELFRTLPWREEILRGVLGADLIGFHTHNYGRHFMQSLNSIIGVEHDLGRVNWQGRTIKVDTFPMGIDYKHFSLLAKKTSKKGVEKFPKKNDLKMILSVDRLDYAKGILQKLIAFEELLKQNTSLKGKVTLMLIVVPSRTRVIHYRQLKKEIDELVGKINGQYRRLDWTPIWYLSQNFRQEEIVELYQQAEVLLITSFRDGMNLIAKEYVACRTDQTGVVVISERAGAAREMPESLMVNPNNIEHIVRQLMKALSMPKNDQQDRMKALQKRFSYYDVFWWANSFLKQLNDVKRLQQKKQTRILSSGIRKRLINHYQEAEQRLLIFDYDGTLVDLRSQPEKALPDKNILQTLQQLAKNKRNRVVIVSGRDANFLEGCLGKLPVTLVAEHGQLSRIPGQDWISHGSNSQDWRQDILPILQLYVDRTPGSVIEEKKYGLAWHYRQVDQLLAKRRVKELKDDLRNFTTNYDLRFVSGNKVVEIKPSHINKGTVVRQLLEEQDWDFVLAIGDDTTDEDMYENLGEIAYSIKVGSGNTKARFRIDSPTEVIDLINEGLL